VREEQLVGNGCAVPGHVPRERALAQHPLAVFYRPLEQIPRHCDSRLKTLLGGLDFIGCSIKANLFRFWCLKPPKQNFIIWVPMRRLAAATMRCGVTRVHAHSTLPALYIPFRVAIRSAMMLLRMYGICKCRVTIGSRTVTGVRNQPKPPPPPPRP
jgi:hypothetical protein